MKAVRSMVFRNVQEILEITALQDPDTPGFQVALEPVVKWLIRELRLHGQLDDKIELCLKLDGRPFCGKKHSSLLSAIENDLSFFTFFLFNTTLESNYKFTFSTSFMFLYIEHCK